MLMLLLNECKEFYLENMAFACLRWQVWSRFEKTPVGFLVLLLVWVCNWWLEYGLLKIWKFRFWFFFEVKQGSKSWRIVVTYFWHILICFLKVFSSFCLSSLLVLLSHYMSAVGFGWNEDDLEKNKLNWVHLKSFLA